MSYNIRRPGNFGLNVNSVGQRRNQQGNFQPAGQLNSGNRNTGYQGNFVPQQGSPNSQFPPQQQMQQHQQRLQQQNFETQHVPMASPAPAFHQRPSLQQSAQQRLDQINICSQQSPATSQQIEEDFEDLEQSMDVVEDNVEDTEGKPRPGWKKKPVKLSKQERVRRRNFRLKKVLQPKNALMILNELVGSTKYTVSEAKAGTNQDLYAATVHVEETDYTGVGKSKAAAKTAAAEQAIKKIILQKLRKKSSTVPLEETELKMDDDKEEEQLSWSHLASFAIHKLFSSWDEEGNLENLSALSADSSGVEGSATISKSPSLASLQSADQKPAKKLPENAAQLNPVMLLNQMCPNAKYDEVSNVGNPPNVLFTISCTVNGSTFLGTGQNKKTARKNAAYNACKSLFNVEYPPEVLEDVKNEPAPAI